MDKKSLKVKIFLNFFVTYIKVPWVADIYTTVSDCFHKKHFSLSLILFKLGKSKLQACNVKEKRVILHKDLSEIFEIL